MNFEPQKFEPQTDDLAAQLRLDTALKGWQRRGKNHPIWNHSSGVEEIVALF
jgi:hypothetical protein